MHVHVSCQPASHQALMRPAGSSLRPNQTGETAESWLCLRLERPHLPEARCPVSSGYLGEPRTAEHTRQIWKWRVFVKKKIYIKKKNRARLPRPGPELESPRLKPLPAPGPHQPCAPTTTPDTSPDLPSRFPTAALCFFFFHLYSSCGDVEVCCTTAERRRYTPRRSPGNIVLDYRRGSAADVTYTYSKYNGGKKKPNKQTKKRRRIKRDSRQGVMLCFFRKGQKAAGHAGHTGARRLLSRRRLSLRSPSPPAEQEDNFLLGRGS